MKKIVSYFSITDPKHVAMGNAISKQIIDEMNKGKLERLAEFLNTTGLLTEKQAQESRFHDIDPNIIILHPMEHGRDAFLGIIPRPPKQEILLAFAVGADTENIQTALELIEANASSLNIPHINFITPFTNEELEKFRAIESNFNVNKQDFRARKRANRKRRKRKHRSLWRGVN